MPASTPPSGYAATQSDLDLCIAAACAAGREAHRLQGTVTRREKADGTPVSDGDLAADAVIRDLLRAQRPGDAILSEECADDAARLRCRRLWIVDPIDGTRDYLAGSAEWAVQIALAVDGVVQVACLAIPVEDRCLASGPDAVGCIRAVTCAVSSAPAGSSAPQISPLFPLPIAAGRDRLIASQSPRNREMTGRVRGVLPEFTWIPATSVGVKVWRMIEDRADLYVHARGIHEWDVAAPAALLCAAGGTATDLAGGALRYNTASALCPGLIFSRRRDHQAIAARLAAGGIVLAP